MENVRCFQVVNQSVNYRKSTTRSSFDALSNFLSVCNVNGFKMHEMNLDNKDRDDYPHQIALLFSTIVLKQPFKNEKFAS